MDKPIFRGIVNRRPTEIYKDRDNKYYIIVNLPNTLNNAKHAQKIVNEYNGKDKKYAKVILKKIDGKERLFLKRPMSFIEATHFRFVNRDKNILNNSEDSLKNSKSQVKKTSYSSLRCALAVGFSILVLTSSLALANYLGETNDDYLIPTEATQALVEPTETQSPVDEYIDYDDLTYRTWTNSGGSTLIELADALKIADVCYKNVVSELIAYNNSVSEESRYSFDPEKFTPEMFTGEQIRESSLILTKKDINDECRGPFKIGHAAAEEANKISMKLTGEEILVTDEDFYDVVKACRACMYIAIKNYEYCQDVTKNVTPEMVYDTYLYGCGNIRKALRENTYEQKLYSKFVLKYGDILKQYSKQLKSGQTDGSHDRFWNNCYNQLYGVTTASLQDIEYER